MEKRALLLTTIASTIGQFNMKNIKMLTDLGYKIDIASNFVSGGSWNEERVAKLKSDLQSLGVDIYDIAFSRSPFSSQNYKAMCELKRIIGENNYSLIHCQTPVASALTRFCIGKHDPSEMYVLYTCHGYNFHKSSGFCDWLKYYPIEKMLAKYTDGVITINQEDYKLASNLKYGHVSYIHGVGVDVDRITQTDVDIEEYKKQLGIPENAFLILSVGELIPRKNHEAAIRAVISLNRKDIYYFICGEGRLREHLQAIIDDADAQDRIQLIGFRRDIAELFHAADISIIVSKIEGLGLAGIESLAAGTPVIGSNSHGIKDYTLDRETGICVNPNSVEEIAQAIDTLYHDREMVKSMKEACRKKAMEFDIVNSYEEQFNIYKDITDRNGR